MTEIVVSASAPFGVEVMVYEEDTWRILSAGNHIREIREPLEELQHKASVQVAHVQGDLVVHGSRWSAILHDFDSTSGFDDGIVEKLLVDLSGIIEQKQIESIGIQALGCFHGPEPMDKSVARITGRAWPDCLKKLWVIVRDQ